MRSFVFILILLLPKIGSSQYSDSSRNPMLAHGYLRNLTEVRMIQGQPAPMFTNLVHHRLNLYLIKPKFTSNLEIRTRLYLGDQVRMVPDFYSKLKYSTEAIDLSSDLIKTKNCVLHSNIDRLWFQYQTSRWTIRGGRQRINWSLVNVWSPNDLFNSNNLLDFDFEERPGVDGLMLRHLINDHMNISAVVVQNNNRQNMALRYFTDKFKFDFQVNIGLIQDLYTVGLGTAGNFGDVGIKGEVQLYKNKNGNASDCLMVVEGDHVFKKGWYVSSSFLFNQNGNNRTVDFFSVKNQNTSPKNLMPTRWNILFMIMKDINPRFNFKTQFVFAPGSNLFFLFPALSYSLKQNLDIDLIWQSFFSKKESFQMFAHVGYVRISWSY